MIVIGWIMEFRTEDRIKKKKGETNIGRHTSYRKGSDKRVDEREARDVHIGKKKIMQS